MDILWSFLLSYDDHKSTKQKKHENCNLIIMTHQEHSKDFDDPIQFSKK